MAEDERGRSNWDVFANWPGKVVNGDTGAVVCDNYHRCCQDMQLRKALGVGAYRFSVACSRILAEGTPVPKASTITSAWSTTCSTTVLRVGPPCSLGTCPPRRGRVTARRHCKGVRGLSWLHAGRLGERVHQFMTANELRASPTWGVSAASTRLGRDRQSAQFRRAQRLHANLRSRQSVRAARLNDNGAHDRGPAYILAMACECRRSTTDPPRRKRAVEAQGTLHLRERLLELDTLQTSRVDDADRVMYLYNYLGRFRRAAVETFALRGYFLWRVTDKFEWADGYAKRQALRRISVV